MFLRWFNRLILALTATVIPATFLYAAHTCCADTPPHVSLVGQLLIASPEIRDPHFDHAVVLVVHHDRAGAMGIVINVPRVKMPLAQILKLIGETDTDVKGEVQVFAGGPVQPEVGFIIHSADYRRPETRDVNGSVLMTSNSQIIRDISRDEGPKKSIIAFGYTGWAAGQLEDELGRRVWFTTPGDQNLIFYETREKLWETAYARRSQDL